MPSRVAIAVADRLLCGLVSALGRLRRGRWPGAIGPLVLRSLMKGAVDPVAQGNFAAWLVSVLSKDYALTTQV